MKRLEQAGHANGRKALVEAGSAAFVGVSAAVNMLRGDKMSGSFPHEHVRILLRLHNLAGYANAIDV